MPEKVPRGSKLFGQVVVLSDRCFENFGNFLKSSAARRDLRSFSVWGLLQARDVLFLPDFAVLRKCFVRESILKLVIVLGTAAVNASYYAGKSPARVQNIGRHCSAVQSRFF